MRKTIYYLLSLAPAVLFAGCEKGPDTPALEPSIEIGVQGSIQVLREGGTVAIPYTVTNPVEGGSVLAEVNDGVEWISGFDYSSEDAVVCTAEENTVTDNRSAIITLTYIYGDGQSVSDQVNVIQQAAIIYDYTLQASELKGHYYGTRYGNNGEYNYYTWISDLPFDDLGRTQPGGTYYLFDLYAGAPENEDKPLPPAGTYTLAEEGSTEEMTFSREYSRVWSTDEAGNVTVDEYFSDGTVTISYDGTVMNLEASLTDTEGKWHHVIYSHETPDYLIGNGGISPGGYLTIERDVNVVPVTYSTGYMGEGASEDVMDVIITFSDMEEDESGESVLPGYNLGIEFFTPYDENGAIAEGTYTIDAEKAENGEAFSIVPGEMYTLLGFLFPYETFLQYLEPAENPDDDPTEYYGFCNEGTMTVSRADEGYRIDCDFYTEEGSHVTCTYTGDMRISGVPGPLSTLTGDYTLDLSNATDANAVYFGDVYYSGGAMWMLRLYPSDGVTGDGFMTTVVGESTDYASGIPSGTYTATTNSYYMMPGQYLYGYLSSSGMNGTFYLGGFLEDKSVTRYAPAMSGDLDIENHGDGTYTISFEFLDDRGYTWDGSWTGTVATEDNTGGTASIPITVASDSPVKSSRKPASPIADRGYLTSRK